MEEKMETEPSISSESSSSSGSSSGSTAGDDEPMELISILGQSLELPQDLCEDYGVFREFFSMRTWQDLNEEHKSNLKQFLPKFEHNDEEEKEKTLRMLFGCEPFWFTSPLNDFFSNLRQGNYRPDIAKMRKFLKKARAKQQKHKIKSYYAKLLPELLISRERLLAVANSCPPGPIPRLPRLPTKINSKTKYKPLYLRVKSRYFEELAAIKTEVGGEESADDNYPDGPPETTSKKRKAVTQGPSTSDGSVSGTLGGMDPSQPSALECLKNVLATHRARRQYRENHPELNTTGITLDDIKQRVALVNGAKKLMFGGQKVDMPLQKLKRGPRKEKQVKSDGKGKGKKTEEPMETVENKPLLPNIKIKCEQEESDMEMASVADPMATQHAKKILEQSEIKQEVIDPSTPMDYSDANVEIKQEPMDTSMPPTQGAKIVHMPIKLEDLDGIDMMALPIEIADDSGEVVVNTSNEGEDSLLEPDEALAETTHANFLSLVRALFPARAAHRASKEQLHKRCEAVIRSPIAPLNTWYNMADDWCAELDSALQFLAGERGPHPDDFVPYLQYIPDTQMYQWIGAGRDCDALLGRLCERWLRAISPTPHSSSDPAPPKYPTSWVVRTPTSAEIAEFRVQERKRFASAAKPFTYVQFGYRSVVGPVSRIGATGSFCAGVGLGALRASRPRHASFVALVRDAVARLPNGEGTRNDVLTLLKMSQWISPTSEATLLSSVSAALEKLLSAKRDPILKFDQRTASWTYLHRHRSEEDWLKASTARGRGAKAAAQAQALAALRKALGSDSGSASTSANVTPLLPPPPAPPATPTRTPHAFAVHSPPHAMDMEVASVEEVVDGSDTDVDVDDSSSPLAEPRLSSAQLLMQATQSLTATPTLKPPLARPRGKLVAVTPPKAKPKPTPPKPKAPPTKPASLVAAKETPAKTAAAAKPATTKPVAAAKPTTPQPKPSTSGVKPTTPPKVTLPQTKPLIPPPKQTVIAQLTKQTLPKTNIIHTKQVVVKPSQSPKTKTPSNQPVVKQIVAQQIVAQQIIAQQLPKQEVKLTPVPKPPQVTVPASKSPSIKQRLLLKSTEVPTSTVPASQSQSIAQTTPAQAVAQSVPAQAVSAAVSQQMVPPAAVVISQSQAKVAQGPRSLLIRPASQVSGAATAASQALSMASRRGVVRVLSPAQAQGKSLISPRALLPQLSQLPSQQQQQLPSQLQQQLTMDKQIPPSQLSRSQTLPLLPSRTQPPSQPQPQPPPAAKKRADSVANIAQMSAMTTVVSSVPTAVTSSVATRTVQLAGGRTVQLAANQTVHLPGGQAVQLSSGHTLQLSSLQLPTHSVRLPSGQTVQLASPQALRAVSKTSSPRAPPPSPTMKPTVQIPISSVQLAGQTVQLAGQTVQIAGQSVQLTGHTVKLPSGQTVQVASQSVLSSQSVQLPSGQTVQIASGNVQLGQNVQNVQTVQLPSGQTVQLPSGQTVQLSSGQTVHLPSGQTVQLPGGQTVQLPGGQTVQLPGGQTVQLPSGQTLQLASGQTLQLASQQAKAAAARAQATEKAAQPLVAKLLANAQAQMVSLEGAGSSTVGSAVSTARALQAAAASAGVVGASTGASVGGNVRVVTPARARPLLLSAAKPLHNIILQQSDGSVRVTSTGGASTSQTIVLSNIGSQSSTTTSSAPVLKLQQAASSTVPTSSVRSVLMDGQQLKLVGGRHVLARILRPAQPPQPPQPPS